MEMMRCTTFSFNDPTISLAYLPELILISSLVSSFINMGYFISYMEAIAL